MYLDNDTSRAKDLITRGEEFNKNGPNLIFAKALHDIHISDFDGAIGELHHIATYDFIMKKISDPLYQEKGKGVKMENCKDCS